MKVQLNKYLALCGVSSRRKSNLYIAEGRVQINGTVVERFGVKVDMDADEVVLDNRVLSIPEHRYVLLNKPAGVITSAVDKRGRKTVLDLVDIPQRIFPVGRLDLDTEGVLLLTNDGDLSFRLAHPKFEIDKIYQVLVRGRVATGAIEELSQGVEIEPGVTVAGEVSLLGYESGGTRLSIRIHEGKKRQIKRMMKRVGHPVLYLNRTLFAGLTTAGVEKGCWRYLSREEVDDLYSMVNMERLAG